MEIIGSFLDEEWESLSKMFSDGDNLDFLLHCDGSSLFPSKGEIPSTAFFASCENGTGVFGSSFLPSDHTCSTNFCCISQESSNSTRPLFPNNTSESMNIYNMDYNNGSLMIPDFSDDVMEEILHLNSENRPAETSDSCKEMQFKRKYETQDKDKSENYSPESPKKIPRVSRNAQKNRMAVQSRKNKKMIQDKNNDEENTAARSRHSSSSYSSEDDSNASQELNGGSTSESKGSACLNSKGKSRVTRGSATDPQSLYARKRRERINERLKILQNLVPNGTKVDISTMLEEAVNYVKFLQLQIKLLSSDDMWMYAPIAYNGMDIGMYPKISSNLMPQN